MSDCEMTDCRPDCCDEGPLDAGMKAMIQTMMDALVDVQKFEGKGNDSAAARARKALQKVAVGCKEMRAAIQAARK
jgi:uncharacterized protein (DUF2237 family)